MLLFLLLVYNYNNINLNIYIRININYLFLFIRMESFIVKYKPLLLNDFELNNNIVDLLKIFIKMDSLNILLIGDSCSGKTSILQSIIREYYQNEKYEDATINEIKKSMDENIMYINSLNDKGIQYYRNHVKTFCQTKCSIRNKKKIVVIDDIDFINGQSQQVFRNCIDKYSDNVHFIASCSNPQKVVNSIQSRISIIKLHNLNNKQLYNIIKKICVVEHIKIQKKALDFILSICNSSIRILLNYLEKFKLMNQMITYDMVLNICTNINFDNFKKYIVHCKNGNIRESIDILYSIYEKGYSVMDILDSFFLFIKSSSILNENEKYMITPIICKYISIFHMIHESNIELSLFTNDIIRLFTTSS